MFKRHDLLGLMVWLVISFVAAAIGSVASIHAAEFYTQLVQPGWAPPPALFGPVWTVLYILMGISAWLVWRSEELDNARGALTLFLIQLAVNALWSWLFFAWHLGVPALVDLILMWLLIICTIRAFWRIRPLAGALLLPYLLWVSFAGVLNYTVLQLNPQILG